MAEDHLALREALGAGGADVVLAQVLDHRGAGDARKDAHDASAHGERGQDVALPGVDAAGGQDTQVDREDLHELQAQPEVGQRDAGDGDNHADQVKGAPAVHGRQDADDDAQDGRPGDGADGQVDGDGQARHEQRRHRALVGVGNTKVSLQNARDPLDVLGNQGLVQTELAANLVDLADRSGGTRDLTGRVTGDHVDEQEDDDRDDKQKRNHAQDSLGYVFPHATPPFLTTYLTVR